MMRLDGLSKLVSGILVGDPQTEITDAASISRAGTGDLTFVSTEKYLEEFLSSNATAAVVKTGLLTDKKPTIQVDDVEAAFAQIVRHFRPLAKHTRIGISPQAMVSSSAIIAEDVDIHPGAFIGDRVEIGCGTVIFPNATILENSRIGSHVRIYPSATLYANTIVGDRAIIHAGVVLGAFGFGYKTQNGEHQLTSQLGNVVIGCDVEIGANSTIDRGTYEPTVIGDGSKLDDQVMIGHNCQIGKYNLLCSQVGIAGSCTTGDHVVMAGQVGIGDHIDIGNNVTLIAKAGVMKDIEENQVLAGAPAIPVKKFFQLTAVHAKLPEMRKQLKKLTQQIEELQQQASQFSAHSDAA